MGTAPVASRSAGSTSWAQGSRLQQTAEALRAQVDSGERMEVVIADAVDRLRLLDARMDETVTRAIELTVQANTPDDLGGLGADVEGLVLDMEALSQALDETSASGRSQASLPMWDAPATPPPATSPPAEGEGRTEPPTASGAS